eukprot:749555-Pelagomonas_calceolata.AAC.1
MGFSMGAPQVPETPRVQMVPNPVRQKWQSCSLLAPFADNKGLQGWPNPSSFACDHVTFTYHNGLRDDELLVYYGFLTSPPSQSSVPQVSGIWTSLPAMLSIALH